MQDGIDTGEPETSYSQLVAIHAGIEKDKKLEPQLEILRKRDVTSYRLEALSGRKNVWEMHPVESPLQNQNLNNQFD